MGACTQTHLNATTHTHTHTSNLAIAVLYTVLPLSCESFAYTYCTWCMTYWTFPHYSGQAHAHNADGTVYTFCSLFICTIHCGLETWSTTKKSETWIRLLSHVQMILSPLHVSCYLYLLHVFEMYVVNNSSNLNVIQSTLWNGSGCINTISWES